MHDSPGEKKTYNTNVAREAGKVERGVTLGSRRRSYIHTRLAWVTVSFKRRFLKVLTNLVQNCSHYIFTSRVGGKVECSEI